MKKQAEVKLVKKAVVEAVIAETARTSSAMALSTLDEHLFNLPLDIVSAARRAFASGKASLQTIVQGAKNLAAKRRNDILAADRERERELARKAREAAAAEAAAKAEAEAAAAKERVKELAEAEEDESVKALLLASLEAPTAKKRAKSTAAADTTSSGEKPDYAGKIRAALPGTIAEVCERSGLPALKVKHYISHYITLGIIGGPRKPLSTTHCYTLLK